MFKKKKKNGVKKFQPYNFQMGSAWRQKGRETEGPGSIKEKKMKS